MSVIFLNTEIIFECLYCGHAALLHEPDLRKFGEQPGAPLSPLSKRLVCKECKTVNVRAYRRIDNMSPRAKSA